MKIALLLVLALVLGACSKSEAPPSSPASPSSDPAAAAFSLEPGVDRGGDDLTSMDLPAADPALCRKACFDDARCKAFTYVKPGVQGEKARCWLKEKAPEAAPNDCCTSGVRK